MPNNDFPYGLGALPSPLDLRTYLFAAPSQEFDWDLGFDIELLLGYRKTVGSLAEFWGSRGAEGWGIERYKEIVDEVKRKDIKPFRIPVNDQNGSGSCVGQSVSKYVAVLNMIETGQWVEMSAKDVYKWVSVGYGQGAYLSMGIARPVNYGVAEERLVPSYKDGKPASEDFYLQDITVTPEIEQSRVKFLGRSYNGIMNQGSWIDSFAWAMLYNFGCVFGTAVHNGGTWSGEYPKIDSIRGFHALFGGKTKLVSSAKHIGDLNSWGASVGNRGWQFLSDAFFKADGLGVFEGWTMVDLANEMNLRQGIIKSFMQIEGEATLVIRDMAGKYYPIATPPELWKYVQKKYNLPEAGFARIQRSVVYANLGGVAEVDVFLKTK